MFDISWSELLILGVVTLIFVGPKELPVFLRTIGKYVGMVKRQAAEFRAQFDEAMREAEVDQLRKQVESTVRDMETTVRDAERSVTSEIDDAKRSLDDAAKLSAPDPDAHDADGIPLPRPAKPAAAEVTAPSPVADTPASTPASIPPTAAPPASEPTKTA